MPNILFLISDTGGGHRASANAISEGLAHLHGDSIRCHIVDFLAECAPWPLRNEDLLIPESSIHRSA